VHELVANGRNDEQIAREIGADRLIFQDLDDLIDAAREGNAELKQFDASCFDGQYITGHVSREYLDHIEGLRSDGTREKHSSGKSGSVEPRVFAVR
jgi:amidophosphoribosyltransferase